MTALEMAANEAAEALRQCDRNETGYIISGIADDYGVDRSELGRELNARMNSRRPKKEEKVMNGIFGRQKLNLPAIEWYAKEKGFSMKELAVAIGRNDDYWSDQYNRSDTRANASTYNAIAETLGIPVESVVLINGQQIEFPEMAHKAQIEHKTGQQDTAAPEEVTVRKEELRTQGRKGCKAVRINMAFTPTNYSFIKIISRASGKTMTQFCNLVIKAYQAEHPEMMGKVRELSDMIETNFSKLFSPEIESIEDEEES